MQNHSWRCPQLSVQHTQDRVGAGPTPGKGQPCSQPKQLHPEGFKWHQPGPKTRDVSELRDLETRVPQRETKCRKGPQVNPESYTQAQLGSYKSELPKCSDLSMSPEN